MNQNLSNSVVDPFAIPTHPEISDADSAPSWQEKAWLVLFDLLIALALFLLLASSLSA